MFGIWGHGNEEEMGRKGAVRGKQVRRRKKNLAEVVVRVLVVVVGVLCLARVGEGRNLQLRRGGNDKYSEDETQRTLFVGSSQKQRQQRGPARLPHSPFPIAPSCEYGHTDEFGIGKKREVIALNVTDARFDERVLAMSLSGLVAKRCPEVAVVHGGDAAISLEAQEFVLETILDSVIDIAYTSEIQKILVHYANMGDIAGYCLADGGYEGGVPIPGSDNGSLHVAVNLSGVLRCVVVTEMTREMAEVAGLGMVADARQYESLDQIFFKYAEYFSDKFLLNQPVAKLEYSIDFAIYSSSFVLFDQGLTMPLSKRLLNHMSDNALVLGWGLETELVASASKRGLAVMCSDFTRNLPLFMNVPKPSPTISRKKSRDPSTSSQLESCSAGSKHIVAFYMTDGDNVGFDLGNFVDPNKDWWMSRSRGKVPIAWSMQPMMQEVHPYFVDWLIKNATENDSFIAGPSGAGYSYIDLYPSTQHKSIFTEWTAQNILNARWSNSMLNIVDKIQMREYNQSRDTVGEMSLSQTVAPEALIIAEYLNLTIRGDAYMLPNNKTIVTSRRYALSKSYGINTEQLAMLLNSNHPDPSLSSGYSLIEVEVWSYGVKDVVDLVEKLDPSLISVVPISAYFDCMRRHIFQTPLMAEA